MKEDGTISSLHHLTMEEDIFSVWILDSLSWNKHLFFHDFSHLTRDKDQRFFGGSTKHLTRDKSCLLSHVHQSSTYKLRSNFCVKSQSSNKFKSICSFDCLTFNEQWTSQGLTYLTLCKQNTSFLLLNKLTHNKPSLVVLKIDSG